MTLGFSATPRLRAAMRASPEPDALLLAVIRNSSSLTGVKKVKGDLRGGGASTIIIFADFPAATSCATWDRVKSNSTMSDTMRPSMTSRCTGMTAKAATATGIAYLRGGHHATSCQTRYAIGTRARAWIGHF